MEWLTLLANGDNVANDITLNMCTPFDTVDVQDIRVILSKISLYFDRYLKRDSCFDKHSFLVAKTSTKCGAENYEDKMIVDDWIEQKFIKIQKKRASQSRKDSSPVHLKCKLQ